MNEQTCENCRYSYWLGNPIWSGSGLRCSNGYSIALVNFNRTINKKLCDKYKCKYN